MYTNETESENWAAGNWVITLPLSGLLKFQLTTLNKRLYNNPANKAQFSSLISKILVIAPTQKIKLPLEY